MKSIQEWSVPSQFMILKLSCDNAWIHNLIKLSPKEGITAGSIPYKRFANLECLEHYLLWYIGIKGSVQFCWYQ